MSSLFDKLTGKSSSNTTNDASHNSASHSSASSSTSGSTTTGAKTTGASTTQTTTQTTTQQHQQPGMVSGAAGATTATGTGTGTGYSGTGQMTDNAMTRSEEQLRVGKEVVGAGKASLDKYVTTEHVQKSVPVTKERVVIEREPVNRENMGAATSGVDITEAHHEVTLTEERAIAAKEVVPIERIRLGKQVETQEQTVGADLRKEHIDLTTTGINEKFDNVGYGTTTGTKIDPTMNQGAGTTTTTSHTTSKTGAGGANMK